MTSIDLPRDSDGRWIVTETPQRIGVGKSLGHYYVFRNHSEYRYLHKSGDWHYECGRPNFWNTPEEAIAAAQAAVALLQGEPEAPIVPLPAAEDRPPEKLLTDLFWEYGEE